MSVPRRWPYYKRLHRNSLPTRRVRRRRRLPPRPQSRQPTYHPENLPNHFQLLSESNVPRGTESLKTETRTPGVLCIGPPHTHTLPSTHKMPSSSSFTAIIQSQLSTAIKKVLADMDALGDEGDEFIAAVFHELFPGADAPAETKADSDSESTESKKGRKKGPMTEEAKAAMVAKRKATMEAKAAAPADAPAPEPKAKLSKEEASKARSEAAKARYAALSEEEKAANKARLAAGKAAKKAVAAATSE